MLSQIRETVSSSVEQVAFLTCCLAQAHLTLLVKAVAQAQIWLVFCPGNSLTKSCEFLEDGISGGSPHEGLCICVVGTDEAVDFFDEVGGGLEGATTDGALGDECEEPFDLVEP